MNKRQAKKQRKKEWDLGEYHINSYKELKKINRAYEEYFIELERKRKKCIGCTHYSTWKEWLYFEPCCYCTKI